MGKRKVSILEPAATAAAEVAFFIESKGLPETAKKIIDEVFGFFEKLSDDILLHKKCKYQRWRILDYGCVNYKKKYVIAYLSMEKEVVICDFLQAKLLKE